MRHPLNIFCMKKSVFIVVSLLYISTAWTQENPEGVKIGNQIWMQRNLDVTTYRNGDTIPMVSDNTTWKKITTGAWCYYENDSATYAATYGKLYNWYAVTDPRGLAPAGWHIPNSEEWNVLVKWLGGIRIAGGKMKATGTTNWLSPNTDATNSSKFTGLPGGYRYNNGKFFDMGTSGNWWSTSAPTVTEAWAYGLGFEDGEVGTDGAYKRSGFSVRCIKD